MLRRLYARRCFPCGLFHQSSLRYGHKHICRVCRALGQLFRSLAGATHCLPCFYPHSNGPRWARCKLGSDLKPRSITIVTDLGCWVLPSLRRSFERSSDNTQSPEQGGGCRACQKLPDICWPASGQLMSAPYVLQSGSVRSEIALPRWRVRFLVCPGLLRSLLGGHRRQAIA
jgi:hypothetical protein